MGSEQLLMQAKKDFKPVIQQWKLLGILIFGSHAWNLATPRSDVDVCIVAPNSNRKQLRDWLLRKGPGSPYDIKIFKVLPLFLKMEVIERHQLIYSPDPLELYEYFYFYRKIWKDQATRNTLSRDEIKSRLKNMSIT